MAKLISLLNLKAATVLAFLFFFFIFFIFLSFYLLIFKNTVVGYDLRQRRRFSVKVQLGKPIESLSVDVTRTTTRS